MPWEWTWDPKTNISYLLNSSSDFYTDMQLQIENAVGFLQIFLKERMKIAFLLVNSWTTMQWITQTFHPDLCNSEWWTSPKVLQYRKVFFPMWSRQLQPQPLSLQPQPQIQPPGREQQRPRLQLWQVQNHLSFSLLLRISTHESVSWNLFSMQCRQLKHFNHKRVLKSYQKLHRTTGII